MKTLYESILTRCVAESILDADFAERKTSLEEIVDFTAGVDKFRPWASNWSSGSLLYTFFDEQPDPVELPEHLYKGFNRTKYNKIQKEIQDLAVKTINKLSE